jgi:C4-dicarboxylate transporter DctQ subunit
MKILDRLEETLIAFLMATATLIIFAAVIHRYASTVPLLYPYMHRIDMSWAQEVCIYMFVWMAKFGAAYGVRTGVHVGVDVMINKLSDRWRKVCIVFGLLAGAGFTATIGTLGAHFVWQIAHTDQTSPDLEAPMWLIYLCIPVGSYLMSFRFLQVCWSFIRTGHLPHHDESHVEGLEEEDQAYELDDNLHPHEVRPQTGGEGR